MASRNRSRRMLVAALTVMIMASSLTLSDTARAAADARIRVAVVATGKDRVGTTLAHRLREGFRASTGFRLVEQKTDALWIVHLITIPGTAEEIDTVYAVVWTLYDFETESEVLQPRPSGCAA